MEGEGGSGGKWVVLDSVEGGDKDSDEKLKGVVGEVYWLIWTVVSYAIEKWDWWEREKVEGVCGWREETWEHVWAGCWDGGRGMGWQDAVGVILGDDGEWEDWLRLLEE
ncbi:hypothetical protein PV325_011958 [Microctonus aethiopoides]|nr:hypothetical protein PV325_011958 [Microctonus aethiopoides]